MTINAKRASFPRMMDQFLRQRGGSVLPPRDLERLSIYLRSLILERSPPPRTAGARPDWTEIASSCGIDPDALINAGRALEPGIDAITRFVGPRSKARKSANGAGKRRSSTSVTAAGKQPSTASRTRGRPRKTAPVPPVTNDSPLDQHLHTPHQRKRGVQPRPVVEFPEPLWAEWEEPETFPEALKLHIDRHSDSAWHLHRAVVKPHEAFDHKTSVTWTQGTKAPRSVSSFEILSRIERRYRLPEGYFKAKLAHPARAVTGHRPTDVTPSQLRRIAWHLPDDFDRRPPQEQEEILRWVKVPPT
jgi:hypothetical protein